MATQCKECKSFFPMDENPEKGDCVQRVVDPRQAFHTARPVDAGRDASRCGNFSKR